MSPSLDIPFLGTLVLSLALVFASYAFAVSVAAGRGRPQLLPSARFATIATCAMVAAAVFLLAYAFQIHDFRIRYVARYSDRSMGWGYLLTSLWGGQDGSLLWWTFLLSGYTFAFTRWTRGRYAALQPYALAVLLSIFIFFLVLMLFAADPFATQLRTAPADGEGLNPLLQNYWMAIHPPSLYLGFVGWSVPFAIVVAALLTGRVGNEWLEPARFWSMIAWTFLSIGLLLGCLWSYEELGWGGYWAWDPVENASFMPWLVGTAFLHSIIIQERYQMMRVWNVFLLCLTFFMTIFGTFLTRSGLIASVHSFARSDIGQYFVYYMVFLIVGIFALIAWRLPKLKAQNEIQSLLSREFAFLLNNWVLLGMMFFVLIATTFPLLSEWLRDEEVTVGPGFYNKWMVPFGLMLLFLAGIGPLISWRKATQSNFLRAMFKPALFALLVCVLQFMFGDSIGLPATIESDAIYDTMTGKVLAAIETVTPVAAFSICAFVLGSVFQEFARGVRVRMNKGENVFVALGRLTTRMPRRYGGYVVHIGIVVMCIGFTGAAYDQEKEAALRPGETMSISDASFKYEGPRMETDPNKRMVFADMSLIGAEGLISPAKFIYRSHPQMPTTEVAIRSNAERDLYVIMSTVDPSTKRATFRIIVRPLVFWIWLGGMIVIVGCLIAMWPNSKALAVRARPQRSKTLAVATLFAVALASTLLLAGVSHAQSDSSSSLHAGSVVIDDPVEKHLFGRLLCMWRLRSVGALIRSCGWADTRRSNSASNLTA
ncbi:MAG: heme lyase CcmF/NrfE family subunit [Polyangiales bacterium]